MSTARLLPQRAHRSIVVAIPARDEADRIGLCLDALRRQTYKPDTVVLLLNNCTDETEAVARGLAPDLPFALEIVCRTLPPDRANAGHARSLAMALGAHIAGLDGVLLTTDADAVVPPDWIHRNLASLLRGADLVCGRAVIDPAEQALIPAHLHADDVMERRLIGLLDDMAWQIDPEPHDPPPRHTEASGASLAVWVASFDRVGGIPPVPSGEDRAFVDAVWQADGRIRHDPGIAVIVSARTLGRAVGGMAETICRRLIQQDEFCDQQVVPAEHALRRLSLRRRVRSAWQANAPDRFLAMDLGIEPKCLAALLKARFFGRAWTEITSRSPALRHMRVRFTDLPAEIETAAGLLARLSSPQTMAAE